MVTASTSLVLSPTSKLMVELHVPGIASASTSPCFDPDVVELNSQKSIVMREVWLASASSNASWINKNVTPDFESPTPINFWVDEVECCDPLMR